MIVVWTAEFAQSYIAQARSSRRPSPSLSSNRFMASAQNPCDVHVPHRVFLRQPGRQALPAAATRETGRQDCRLRGADLLFQPGLERCAQRRAIRGNTEIDRSPLSANDNAGKV